MTHGTAADIEAEREERAILLDHQADQYDSTQGRIRRLEDEVKELKEKVRELYEEKMSRLHGGGY